MQLRMIREGDEVVCNVRGRKFPAIVERLPERNSDPVQVTPLVKNISYFNVTKYQIEKRVTKRGKAA